MVVRQADHGVVHACVDVVLTVLMVWGSGTAVDAEIGVVVDTERLPSVHA